MGAVRTFLTRVERRLRTAEEGFTLIETLNVMLIMGILMSISYSSYSTLRSRAEQRSAEANLSAIIPAVNSWRIDNGTYAGMTMPLLNANYLDGTIDVTFYDVGAGATASAYCLQYTVPTGDYTARILGPAGTISVAKVNSCP
jgi:prepilin-type N-terminal cleavage/methylation domain-containing protein